MCIHVYGYRFANLGFRIPDANSYSDIYRSRAIMYASVRFLEPCLRCVSRSMMKNLYVMLYSVRLGTGNIVSFFGRIVRVEIVY